MNWYLVYLTRKGKNVESGWMLAADDMELVSYARAMGCSIDIRFMGKANMNSFFPEILH